MYELSSKFPPEKRSFQLPPVDTIWGLSVVCSATVTLIRRAGAPAKPVPLWSRRTPHTCEGADVDPSLVFHTRKAAPVAGSTKGLGSSTPPGGHHGESAEVSVNRGLVGVRVAAVATDRQVNPVSTPWPARAASYQRTQWPPV